MQLNLRKIVDIESNRLDKIITVADLMMVAIIISILVHNLRRASQATKLVTKSSNKF
jgi:hypothetical protein